jgi:predicted ATP-grasp superfamily ATP-dependent carboligase
MSRQPDNILVVALSGRALAQSASAASIPVSVLDVYGDEDTRMAAVSSARIGDARLQISRNLLLETAERLYPAHRCPGLVYGAGFESDPQTLTDLAAGRELLGNAPDLLSDLGTPRYLFPLLDRLGIPHPAVTYRRPADSNGWLAKQAGCSGGGHVMPARRTAGQPGVYYQRKLPGRVMSVLFLCNGRQMAVVPAGRAAPGGHACNQDARQPALPARPEQYGSGCRQERVSRAGGQRSPDGDHGTLR